MKKLIVTFCLASFVLFVVGGTLPKQQKIQVPAEGAPVADEKQQQPLVVHVIAHTHDDVGWLKTVDQYYIGSNMSIQDAGVQYIIDTVIQALQLNPDRRFIYVEIAFFERWWREQSEDMKQIVRDLVATGRFEFINGGWCMNDEAATHYQDVIDQMTQGHDFLFREFGVRPRIGWHIDPFGHAASQASLFAQMGFDAFFFGRIDYSEHSYRNSTQNLEFVWRGSNSLGKTTQIFSHVLYTDYCYLHGFAWEWGDEPIQDDPRLYDVNAKIRADAWASAIRTRAAGYRTQNILAPFGCDFQFMNAHMNFKNMDKLMRYINSHPEYNMKLIYSTPSIYLDALYDENLTWSVKTGDFFPYGDNPHAYWSGYFTSRPGVKGYVRTRANLLHTADHLLTLSTLPLQADASKNLEEINQLFEALSIAQHHDAVSGTEKQHVANDYSKRLSIGSVAAQSALSDVTNYLINNTQGASFDFAFCEYMNVSVCPGTVPLAVGQDIAVVLHNHLAWARKSYVRIPVPLSSIQVLDASNQVVSSQVYASPDDGVGAQPYIVIFEATLPAAGYTTYFLSKGSNVIDEEGDPNADIILENAHLRVVFSGTTNRLASIYHKGNQDLINVTQDYLWYNGSDGNNKDSDQASGAYIFRPNGTNPFPVISGNPSISVILGSVVQEVRQTWNNWVSQVVRLYTDANYLEVESTVGPIDISDNLGKEVITRYSTSLNTNGNFYTDSEGLEFIQRVYNYRPWPGYNITEPVACNYYPSNIGAFIKDSNTGVQLTFLNDRSRGASSLANGQLETMVNRRLLYDDARGVGEALNETLPFRTTHVVLVERATKAARHYRHHTLTVNNPPLAMFAPVTSISEWISQLNTTFVPLLKPLPANVHLLNLRTQMDGRVLLRLQHIFAVGEDHDLARPVTVDLNQLFVSLTPVEVTEMTMTANRPLKDLHRLQWNTVNDGSPTPSQMETTLAGTTVTLNPMEIRTYLVRFTLA